MRIGEMARRVGVSERALRYYEEQGLLAPRRLDSGYRDYGERELRAVRHIRLLLSAGLPTTAIAEILACMPDDTEVLAPTCPELIDGLVQERQRITSAIDDLVRARDILETIIGGRGGRSSISGPRPDAAPRGTRT